MLQPPRRPVAEADPALRGGGAAPAPRPAPFDGRRFFNADGAVPQGPAGALRWLLTRRAVPWARSPVQPVRPALQPRVDDGTLHVTPIGHATVLLQVAGLNLLTDPVFSDRIGPLPGVGPRRFLPPALKLADLPPIDVVLLSHNHYDHLDRPSLAGLHRRDAPRLLTGLRVGRDLPRGMHFEELDWTDSRDLGHGLHATFVRAEHFSGRGPLDANATLWGGFVVRTPLGPVYFAGDTGTGSHFREIRREFGPMALSLLPIGAYLPRWFMSPVHVDPAEALQASLELQSRLSVAIHHGVFRLADEGIDAPRHDLQKALARIDRARPGADFRVPAPGETIIVRPH